VCASLSERVRVEKLRRGKAFEVIEDCIGDFCAKKSLRGEERNRQSGFPEKIAKSCQPLDLEKLRRG
jgi:hypothetical protein